MTVFIINLEMSSLWSTRGPTRRGRRMVHGLLVPHGVVVGPTRSHGVCHRIVPRSIRLRSACVSHSALQRMCPTTRFSVYAHSVFHTAWTRQRMCPTRMCPTRVCFTRVCFTLLEHVYVSHCLNTHSVPRIVPHAHSAPHVSGWCPTRSACTRWLAG